MTPKKLPTFDDLPFDKNGPPGNAWGLWGPDDQLGRLNLLTPETTGHLTSSHIPHSGGKLLSIEYSTKLP
ncbi:hypothetical protein LB505_012855 [Fusarium chuoi]|nr:hypothetical protein LB505_012855 [Fusarium chuoi]